MPSTRSQKIDALRARYKGYRMSAYGIAILEDVPGIRPEDTEQIEEVMRSQYSTLDGLTHPVFRACARLAWDVVREMRRLGQTEIPTYTDKETTSQ